MPLDFHSRRRVAVRQAQPISGFIVFIDSKPVLRCAARREAVRYAAMVRRALLASA